MTAKTNRNSYSLKDGLTMMAAKAVGVDPELAAEAGEDARTVINLIRNAGRARTPDDKAGLIRDAQDGLRRIDPAKHGKLVSALSAKLLAAQGRDTENNQNKDTGLREFSWPSLATRKPPAPVRDLEEIPSVYSSRFDHPLNKTHFEHFLGKDYWKFREWNIPDEAVLDDAYKVWKEFRPVLPSYGVPKPEDFPPPKINYDP